MHREHAAKRGVGTVVSTFSICAVDPETGEAGVAVASRAVAVGGLVPYASPGAGAIAVQGCVEPEYGTRGLEGLARGGSAPSVLKRLVEQDLIVTECDDEQLNARFRQEGMEAEGEDYVLNTSDGRTVWFTSRLRQVGMVDARGGAAVHNGVRLQKQPASRIGDGYCCQGSALPSERVVDEMAKAYEQARSVREMDSALVQALLAGVAAGGDKRGTRAAALLVVRDGGHWTGGDRYRDLRVDDHARPAHELADLLKKF